MGTNFNDDLKIEEEFYNKYFRQYLIDKRYDLIYIRYDDKNIIHKELQKKNDIDVIIDTGKTNISLSLKTVRNIYQTIFFETVGNENTGSKGWGYYSKADWIIYSMGNYINGHFPDKFDIYKFKTEDILKLDIDNYQTVYGHTYSGRKLLYRTVGKKIPLADFNNKKLV